MRLDWMFKFWRPGTGLEEGHTRCRIPVLGMLTWEAAYVGAGQDRILRVAKELDLKFYKVNDEGKSVSYMEGVHRSGSSDDPSLLTKNPLALLDMNSLLWKIDEFSKQVPSDAPWKAPRAKEWDSMTVKEFMDKECWTSVTKKMLGLLVTTLACCEPEEISFLFLLGGVASSGGFGNAISEAQAKYVISAIPPTLLHRILFEPPLPGLKIQMIQRMPMGSVIKTMTYYETAFWKDNLGFSGTAMSDTGPVVACMDDTKPDGSFPALVGFITSTRAQKFCDMSVEERKQAVCEHYAEVFQCPEFLHPVHYVEHNWMADTFSGGGPGANLGTGVLTSFGSELRKPFGCVYFAGCETAVKWGGYMDGAVEAGERAAREILHAMGKISEDEIWQEEPPSIDVSTTPSTAVSWEKYLPSVPQLLFFLLAFVVLVVAVTLLCVFLV